MKFQRVGWYTGLGLNGCFHLGGLFGHLSLSTGEWNSSPFSNMHARTPSPTLFFQGVFSTHSAKHPWMLHSVWRTPHLWEEQTLVYTGVCFNQLTLLSVSLNWQDHNLRCVVRCWGLNLCKGFFPSAVSPTRSHKVAQVGFEFLILLPQLLLCWI